MSGLPVPTHSRCFYCWAAAGATGAAWEALELRDIAGSAEHARACEHNPLVRAIRAYVAAMESEDDNDEIEDLCVSTYDALKAAVTP